jgi:hypothetical protein
MPNHLFLCSECGSAQRRYPNARRCRDCGGPLVRQDTTLGNLASQMTALGAGNEALRDRAEAAEATVERLRAELQHRAIIDAEDTQRLQGFCNALYAELTAARAAFQAFRRVCTGRRSEHLHFLGDPPCADCQAIATYEQMTKAREEMRMPETDALGQFLSRLEASIDSIEGKAQALELIRRYMDRQLWRADGLATAAAIALHELEQDGQVQPHTRSLLQSAVDAFEAGKRGEDEQPGS